MEGQRANYRERDLIAADRLFSRRVLHLYLLSLKEPLQRLRHDLAKEIVVALSSFIFIGTFLYVFEDFLNVQVAALSLNMRWWFAAVVQTALLTVVTVVGIRLIHHHRGSPFGLFQSAKALGEFPRVLLVFDGLYNLTLLLCLHGLCWAVCQRWLVHLEIGLIATLSSIQLIFSLLWVYGVQSVQGDISQGRGSFQLTSTFEAPESLGSSMLVSTTFGWTTIGWTTLTRLLSLQHIGAGKSSTKNRDQTGNLESLALSLNKIPILVEWRERQWQSGPPLARWIGNLGWGWAAGMGALVLGLSGSSLMAGLACLVGGLMAATTVLMVIARDLEQVWTERGLGISHEEYVLSYELISWRLAYRMGLSTLAFAVLALVVRSFLGGDAASVGTSLAGASAGQVLWLSVDTMVKMTVLSVLPVLITPWIALQIDGRRPVLGVLITTILALFLGTAILAHSLSLLLIPILRYYGIQSQRGRFYRA